MGNLRSFVFICLAIMGCNNSTPSHPIVFGAQRYEECTLERAKKTDVGRYNDLVHYQKQDDDRYATEVGTWTKRIKEWSQLPAAPAELGHAPHWTLEVSVPAVGIVPKWHQDSETCQASMQYANRSERFTQDDWRHFVQAGLVDWSRIASNYNDDSARDQDMQTGIFLTKEEDENSLLTGNREARKLMVEQTLNALAKGGPALQWAVGMAAKLDPSARQFTALRLNRLNAATRVDFRKLDLQLRRAEVSHIRDITYGCNLENTDLCFGEDGYYEDGQKPVKATGDYYTGLLLRRWREHERAKPGSGDEYIRKVRTVTSGIAKGMGITLTN